MVLPPIQLVYAHVAPQQALPNQFGDELDMSHVDYAVLDHKKLVTQVESVKLKKQGTVLQSWTYGCCEFEFSLLVG